MPLAATGCFCKNNFAPLLCYRLFCKNAVVLQQAFSVTDRIMQCMGFRKVDWGLLVLVRPAQLSDRYFRQFSLARPSAR